VGSSTNKYSRWTTTTTDPDGNIKDYWYDAFGNLANVVEHGTTIATTTYEYDTLNNLATTTDAAGNVRHFTYDGLSRRLTAQDMHAVGDATVGTWTYSYDDAGNITSQTDPKGQVVNRTYDALSRMLTEDYTGASGTEVTLVYDNCANGIGYLCSASSTSATSTNAYDILGRVTSATTTILGMKYNMKYSYDRQGNVTSWTYPNGSQINISYNIAGFPSKVQRKPSGGSFSDIVTSFAYAPTGQITTTVFGSGASTTRTYDPNSVYRLSQLRTLGKSGSKFQDFSYVYDAAGNITQISNAANALSYATTSFSYDALNRLLIASTTAASSSPYLQTYAYDALGSILGLRTGAAASSTYAYSGSGYANPHALTQLSSGTATTTYAYDNNGNLTSAGNGTATTTYAYDYANRLSAILWNNATTTTYGYDAFGQRVYQIIATTSTTTYPFRFFSIASTTKSSTNFATSTEYVFNGDTLLATVDQAFKNGSATGTAQTRYVHPDHLGSTNVVTDQNGNLVQTLDYYPYGGTRISNSTSTNEKRKFIGQFSDDSGLSYLNARYYSSDRGQFISEEPIFQSLGDASQVAQLSGQSQQSSLRDPQQLNSYSYGRDNPISKKDPTGKQYTDVGGSFTVPVYGVPVGPTAGMYFASNGDPYVYFGVSVALRPGPSGSIMYSPTGSPSEGWGTSASGFARGAGAQVGYSQDASGKLAPSTEYGIGTPGFGGSLVYTISVPNLLYAIGGPLQNVTTPMTYKNLGPVTVQTRTSSQPTFGFGSAVSRAAAVNAYNSASGATTNASKLWVTPSGAVVTWSGTVVSGPVSSGK
jgi:RHS repeat-associated protein